MEFKISSFSAFQSVSSASHIVSSSWCKSCEYNPKLYPTLKAIIQIVSSKSWQVSPASMTGQPEITEHSSSHFSNSAQYPSLRQSQAVPLGLLSSRMDPTFLQSVKHPTLLTLRIPTCNGTKYISQSNSLRPLLKKPDKATNWCHLRFRFCIDL